MNCFALVRFVKPATPDHDIVVLVTDVRGDWILISPADPDKSALDDACIRVPMRAVRVVGYHC